jgi:hypothetical protein
MPHRTARGPVTSGGSDRNAQLQSSARAPSLVSTGTSSRISISPNSTKVPTSSGLTGINLVRFPLMSRKAHRRRMAVSTSKCGICRSGEFVIAIPLSHFAGARKPPGEALAGDRRRSRLASMGGSARTLFRGALASRMRSKVAALGTSLARLRLPISRMRRLPDEVSKGGTPRTTSFIILFHG